MTLTAFEFDVQSVLFNLLSCLKDANLSLFKPFFVSIENEKFTFNIQAPTFM